MKIVLIDLTVNIEERLMVVEVRQYIQDNILIFDGAMGTMLQKKAYK